ncbi:MAG: hypothetical protein AAGF60_05145 [Pseudomonadota bacterium]
MSGPEARAARLGAHLQRLAGEVQTLEAVLCADRAGDYKAAPDYVRGLQRLDYLHQALADTAALLRHARLDLDAAFDAEADVTLDVTRALAIGGAVPAAAQGEPDLF